MREGDCGVKGNRKGRIEVNNSGRALFCVSRTLDFIRVTRSC